jgi:hypothetical protein
METWILSEYFYPEEVSTAHFLTQISKKIYNTEKQLKLAIVFVPLHDGDAIQLQKLPYTNLDDWKINANKWS